MAVPANKTELLSAIDTAYAKLLAEIAAIPAGRLDEATLEGHAKDTVMSVHDLVAYLLGWNELVLKWCRARLADTPVDFPETGYGWNELGRLAQKFYADYASLPFPELMAQFARAKAAIVAIIESQDDASLYAVPWYEKWTMGRMIQFNTASPYINARGRLRKWRKRQDLA